MAAHATYLDVGPQLGYLQVIALTLDGSLGSQETHMIALGDIANDFGSRSDDTEHTAGRIQLWDVSLLDGAQGLG